VLNPALVLSDVLAAVDQGDFAALVLVDFNEALDTVDHDIVLEWISRTSDIRDTEHDWFQFCI
jgi:hypothetical protein